MLRPARVRHRPDHDLVVIGGGTGGLVAALVAAGIGAKVALVERRRLGGDCLWTGCVPSKSLLAAAALAHRMRHADRVGLAAVEPQVELARVMDHVREAQRIISVQDSAARLARSGVEVLEGSARFLAPGVIEVGGRRLSWRKAIIATGSRPALPSIPGLREPAALTTESVWELTELPRRLVVLGGGATGCELAQGFARLGSTVALLERGPRLLAGEDPRAADLIASTLGEEGVTVHCGADVLAARDDGDGGALELAGGGAPVAFDRVLLATGREPSSDGLGLEAIGVRTDDHGHVVTDARLRTTAPHVYAVGDVTGAMRFTHVAAYHARVATINALFGARRHTDYRAVPRVAFTDPEVAGVGVTAAEAHARWGEGATCETFDYRDLDRAITEGRARGFVTLVGDPRGRLVGATIAAPGAGESIAELVAWVATAAKIDRVSQTVHAYPTLTEGPSRAADDRLRARYAAPGVQSVARGALHALAVIDRPGGWRRDLRERSGGRAWPGRRR